MTAPTPFKSLQDLIESVKALRGEPGCSWHQQQTIATLAPFTQSEAYELTDAIEQQNPAEIKEELGDLLFHITLYAQHAEEQGLFNFEDIAKVANEKIVRRHPHVFDPNETEGYSGQKWEEIKSQEKKNKPAEKDTLLSGLPKALPSLLTAHEIHKRVNSVGFEWNEVSELFDKIDEELEELQEAIESQNDDHIEDEFGDVLFTVAILGYYNDINPEKALRRANDKFKRRFNFVEERMKANNLELTPANLEHMENFWQECKREEKAKAAKAS